MVKLDGSVASRGWSIFKKTKIIQPFDSPLSWPMFQWSDLKNHFREEILWWILQKRLCSHWGTIEDVDPSDDV